MTLSNANKWLQGSFGAPLKHEGPEAKTVVSPASGIDSTLIPANAWKMRQ